MDSQGAGAGWIEWLGADGYACICVESVGLLMGGW